MNALIALIITALFSFSAWADSLSEPSRFPPLNPAKKFKTSPLDPFQSGVYPVRESSDCEAALLTNGERAFQARYHYGYKAKKSIRAQALLLKADATGLELAKMFKQMVLQNVRVQVIVDAVSNLFDWQTQWMYYDLRENGVEILGYEPGLLQLINEINPQKLEELDMRYHDKIFVVDGEYAVFYGKDGYENHDVAVTIGGDYTDLTRLAIGIGGGMNMEDPYSRIGTIGANRWRDQDFVTRGLAVKDMMDTFDWNWAYLSKLQKLNPKLFSTDRKWTGWRLVLRKMWHFFTHKISFTHSSYMKKLEVDKFVEKSKSFSVRFKEVRGRWLQSKPRFGETYIHESIIDMINAAKEEVWLLNAYFVPGPELAELVEAIKAAARRGVRVNIITNSDKTNDLGIMTDVGRAYYKDILSVNQELGKELVKIYEWQGDFRNGTLHAKAGVVDGVAGWISSYNLDNRSFALNSETAFFFESDEMAGELTDQIQNFDLKKSRKIEWEEALEFKMPSGIISRIRLELAKLLRKEL